LFISDLIHPEPRGGIRFMIPWGEVIIKKAVPYEQPFSIITDSGSISKNLQPHWDTDYYQVFF